MSNCLAISMTSVDSRKKRVFSLISFIHYCSEASNKTARLKTKYIPSKHPFSLEVNGITHTTTIAVNVLGQIRMYQPFCLCSLAKNIFFFSLKVINQ